MKTRFTILSTIFWLLPQLLCAQKINDIHELYFSHEIDSLLTHTDFRESSAAYFYSYIGQYKKAIETYDIQLDWGLDSVSQSDIETFKANYKSVPALPYLESIFKDHQVVIVSEGHHKPQHRLFTRMLLQSLYDQGFRYLGMETLMPNFLPGPAFLMDTALNNRGYALNTPMTGFYTREPQMANLVREAIAIGFELFAYERKAKGERDLAQAKNIQKFMDQHPDEKVLIHCGWYHAIESDLPKRQKHNWMAYHLKQLTGIDPLTIYQDALTEKVFHPSSPLINNDMDQPSLFLNKQEEVYTIEHFDILINHPKTEFIENRPNWLAYVAENKWIPLKKRWIKPFSFPIILKAYHWEEPKEATPVDIYECIDSSIKPYLVLPPGKYRIEVLDHKGLMKTYKLKVSNK